MKGTGILKAFLLVLCLCLLVLLLPAPAPGLTYPSNFRFIEVPDPLSGDNPRYPLIPLATPAPGASYYDPRFGTVCTRITQKPLVRHEYSRIDPCNRDQSRILLQDISSGTYLIYRTKPLPCDQAGNLVRTITGVQEVNWAGEFRWDPEDVNLLWGLRDFSIITLKVDTGAVTVIKDFTKDATMGLIIKANPLLYRITNMDEGESSRDKRFWVFALQNGDDPAHPEEAYVFKYLFTWDRLQNKVLGTYKLPLIRGQNLDWVGMSTLGNWVVIGGGPLDSDPTGWGLMLADKGFTVFHQLAVNTAHADVGLDTAGKEVIVMQNSNTDYVDQIPLDLKVTPVNAPGDYAKSIIKPIVRLYYNDSSPIGLKSGIHVSCNYPGYALISTTIPPATPEQNWLDRGIILVRLDPNKARAVYLAKVYNTTSQYQEETHGSITNDGSKVVWVCNWGNYVPEPGLPKLTLTQLEMPPQWERQFLPPLTPILPLLLGD